MRCLKCLKAIVSKGIYGLHINCFTEWFGLQNKLDRFHSLDPKKPDSHASNGFFGLKKSPDSFYHGRYRKYSAQLGSQHYILKVQESICPDLPATEYLCNRIATLLGIKTPEYYLIRWETTKLDSKPGQNSTPATKIGDLVFISKNFIQGSVSNLHHIYKFLPKGDKNYNCQNIIKALITETSKPVIEVEKFITICLFDSLIGNSDRHGRNLGIIDTGKKRFLAPMYMQSAISTKRKKAFIRFLTDRLKDFQQVLKEDLHNV